MKNTRTLVIGSLFIVLEVITSQYIGYTVATMRFSLTFAIMGICGYLMGWKKGAMIAVAADLIGMVLYPKGPFFIGFTLAAFLAGAFHGLLYQRKGKDLLLWIVIVCILNTVISHIIVNSLSLVVITQSPLEVFIAPRLVKAAIELPITIVVLSVLLKYIEKNNQRFKV